MDNGIVVGIFTVTGTLGGILLTQIFNRAEQQKARRAEYARTALARLRSSADNMELTARHILFILTSIRMGASKTQKNMVNKSLKKIEEDLTTTPILPEILDEKLATIWNQVSHNFGALLVTYNIESPSLLPKAYAERPPRKEFLKKFQEVFSSNDFEAMSKEIAPESESKAIFESATQLIASIIKLREEIRRISTTGK
jgi:hypothetical protein